MFILKLKNTKVLVQLKTAGYIKVQCLDFAIPPYINDLPDSGKNKIGIFANDSTVYNKITFIVGSKVI